MKGTGVIFILASTLFLSGCQHARNNTESVNKKTETTESNQLAFLKGCVKNANTLVKINKKYKADHDELYRLIRDARSYASMSDNISENINITITPLYEYQINYKCNTIMQTLIEELNNRVKNSVTKTGNAS